MNSEILFSLALGLQSPWQVKDVTFSTDESARSEFHLHIDFIPGSRFPDEANVACPVHDTVERQWQHLSFFDHTCDPHCAVPRITTTDGKVRMVDAPCARRGEWECSFRSILSLNHRNLTNLTLPNPRRYLMNRNTLGIHSNRDRHILNHKLMNRFHA